MLKQPAIMLFLIGVMICTALSSIAQKPVNWTEEQLMEPAQLNEVLSSGKDLPVVISMGPGPLLPGAINVGFINNSEGLNNLHTRLGNIPKDKKVIVYCGCCPYEHCPNVRPAIDALKQMQFTDYYLLNLPHNLKRDWIDKGYPLMKKSGS